MIRLTDTNNMLRALGINVARDDETDMLVTSRFDHITGVGLDVYEPSERCIMDAAGWDVDCTPVDVFMQSPSDVRYGYAQGMGVYNEGWSD